MGLYANRIFPWVLDVTEPKEMADQRRLILQDVKGEVLEIGIGTGVNLPYYPDNIKKLAGIEPSDAMRPRAKKRADETGRKIEWYRGLGEQLPFDRGSFDTVVLADVLCTVDNVDAVLEESFRVLKPGGRLHFLEHGLAQKDKIRKWQIRLNGLSKVVGCGCELTRDIEKHIRDSSFVIDELVNVTPFSGMDALYTHIRGVAIKPQ
ncbi:MAG: class I SAM-dependent methyltransferase [Bacteroidales bacterium]|nr:class I SAM-dependent methyltransferase [Bacteroidales bacterium]